MLKNLGFDYIVNLEKQKLNTELLYQKNRDLTHGEELLSFKDLLAFLANDLHKYTNSAELDEAIAFFDNDNDGVIGSADLRSMLNGFGKEETYLNKDQIESIIN